MTEHTPRTNHDAGGGATVTPDLDAWLNHVERTTRNRHRVEQLILAQGLIRPFTLAQRFILKSREIGVGATIRLASGRLRARRMPSR